ncbi:MAG TPA: AAA family ATPase [Actinospica sp.]|jgi:type VII secretion ATPase EccA|nr:AAA family ATPase [Actinospica sp.]
MTSEKVDQKPGVLARRRAESSWRGAMRALKAGATENAHAGFLAAVEHDPTCADGWLGLHHLGIDRPKALWAMEQNSTQLGGLRTRTRTPLSSAYWLGHHSPRQRLDNRLDLWRAVTAHQIEAGNHADAAARLSMATQTDDHIRLLRVNLAVAAGDWTEVLTWGKGVADKQLANCATLHVGHSLVELGAYREATRTLLGLIDRTDDDTLRAAASGWCARAYERLHETENAEKFYQYAFRLDPTGDPDIAAHATAKARVERIDRSTALAPMRAADPAVLEEAWNQLDGLIGLEPVKNQVRVMAAQLKVAAARAAQGLPTKAHSRHFVFTGAPGTGKTEVARIITRILYGFGYIERPDVREVHRVDLVGQYLGATAIKTNAVIDSALGGGLFLDEAYALFNRGYVGDRDAFGDEALQTLLKRAEDDRDRLVIILAGYPDEMDELLGVNPGLASRFATRIHFPSYTSTELVAVATGMATKGQNSFDDAALLELRSIMSGVCESGQIDEVGNARFVRNLYEKAIAQRDLRLADSGAELTISAITTITSQDLVAAATSLVR